MKDQQQYKDSLLHIEFPFAAFQKNKRILKKRKNLSVSIVMPLSFCSSSLSVCGVKVDIHDRFLER